MKNVTKTGVEVRATSHRVPLSPAKSTIELNQDEWDDGRRNIKTKEKIN